MLGGVVRAEAVGCGVEGSKVVGADVVGARVDGCPVGEMAGAAVGPAVGCRELGILVAGAADVGADVVGSHVGMADGWLDVGSPVGTAVGGRVVRPSVGIAVGADEDGRGVDGIAVGANVVAACVVSQSARRERRRFTKKQRCELPPEPPSGALSALTKMAQ